MSYHHRLAEQTRLNRRGEVKNYNVQMLTRNGDQRTWVDARRGPKLTIVLLAGFLFVYFHSDESVGPACGQYCLYRYAAQYLILLRFYLYSAQNIGIFCLSSWIAVLSAARVHRIEMLCITCFGAVCYMRRDQTAFKRLTFLSSEPV